MRYFIELSYNGKNYHGWQIQPNATTVQEVLNKAFSVFLKEDINVIGAGRTDTGVHARFFVAHIDCITKIEDPIHLAYKLNGYLPRDIAISSIYPVNDDMHSRFSATSRSYEYILCRKKNPFLTDSTFYYTYSLDLEKMREASAIVKEYSDFTSFSKLHSGSKTNICEIYQTEWISKGDTLHFHISANRFLRNMVRAITGTLLEVGREKLSLQGFRDVIESKNRSRAGFSVPAQGLYLTHIAYPVKSSSLT